MSVARHESIPKLASRAGRYTEALPTERLRPYFQCAWMNSVSQDHVGPVAVVPDGCVDLLWRNDRLLVVGPDITAAHPDLSPGTTVLGLRFRPGAAATTLRLPLTEITGREVPMAEIWGRRVDRFANAIGSAPTLAEKLRAFQELLTEEASMLERPCRDGLTIFEFMRSHTEHEGRMIKALRDHVGVSERTLRRRCREFFGYGPKTLDRVLRFQRFQALAQSNAAEKLAILALRAGYADQPHLTREIQSLCGMTAGEFVRQWAS
jgi:AraC-like DNA-binding protein